MVLDFQSWLAEGSQSQVSPTILYGYDAEFRRQLQSVIGRVENPTLKAELTRMLSCPIRDSGGQCRSFSEYIYATLLNNGIQQRYDMEAALQYRYGEDAAEPL